jgi:hypothetical protein
MPHINYGKVVTAQDMKAHGQLDVKIPSSLTSALYRRNLSHSSSGSFISAAIGCLRGSQSPISYLVLHKNSVGSFVIPRSSSRQSIYYVGYHIEIPKYKIGKIYHVKTNSIYVLSTSRISSLMTAMKITIELLELLKIM